MQENLARTTQLARPVLQTEITSVCVFQDLLDVIVKTVGNILTLHSKKSLKGLKAGRRWGGEGARVS